MAKYVGIMRYRSKLGEWRDWVYLSLQKSEVKEMIEEAVSAFSVSNSALLKAHGIDDLLHTNLSLEDATTNGVTFKMNPDGSVTVTGTATGAGFTNIYASSTELPEWLERGKEYVFRINDPAGLVRFEVYEYNEDGEMIKGTKGNGCKMRIVKEEELLKTIADQMGWEKFDETRFEAEVERVEVGMDEIRIKRKMAMAV